MPLQTEPTRLSPGDIDIDLLTRRVTRGGTDVRLSARDLLAFFVRRTGQAIAREQVLRGAWEYDVAPGTNVLGVYVGHPRRTLGPPSPTEMVRSVGYRFENGGY